MRELAINRVRQVRTYLIALSISMLVLSFSASTAHASGGVSSIILTKALPGFVESPPGQDNGPIVSSNMDVVFAGDTATQLAQVSQEMSNGHITGYVRLWRHQPLTGDGLLVTVFQAPASYSIATLLAGFENAASTQVAKFNGSTFSVPGVADAQGYNVNVTNETPPFREFTVAFAKGNTAFFMILVSSSDDLSESDAANLAQRQWAKAPGGSIAPINAPSVAEDLLYGALAALVVAAIGIIWRRRREHERTKANTTSDVVGYASYKHLTRAQKKLARKAVTKSILSEDDLINRTALEWANHEIITYWILVAAFIGMFATVEIVSQGHVYVYSFLALFALIRAFVLRAKVKRFAEMLKSVVTPVLNVPPSNPWSMS
jgi:hypothetical protein